MATCEWLVGCSGLYFKRCLFNLPVLYSQMLSISLYRTVSRCCLGSSGRYYATASRLAHSQYRYLSDTTPPPPPANDENLTEDDIKHEVLRASLKFVPHHGFTVKAIGEGLSSFLSTYFQHTGENVRYLGMG